MCSDEYLTAIRKKVLTNAAYPKSISERKIVICQFLWYETYPVLITAVLGKRP